MSSYNKTYLEQIAKEKGFVRDNLEKVIRLSEHFSKKRKKRHSCERFSYSI